MTTCVGSYLQHTPIQKLQKSIIPMVKHGAYQQLRKLALLNNGIIFGGFVRDEYIAEFYTEKFYQNLRDTPNSSKVDNFWDPNCQPATRGRLLCPEDIDISFAVPENAENFIQAIQQMKEFLSVTVEDKTHERQYYSMHIQSIREVNIQIEVGGYQFVSEGKIINIKADVIIPKRASLQPPFRNLDMLCNGFIITKEGGKQFSRHTGTIIDRYNDFECAMVVAQILRDMKDFKTALCFVTNNPSRFRKTLNLLAMKRIEKMHNKRISWSFINLPFNTFHYGKHEETPGWKIPELPIQSGSSESTENNQEINNTECNVCMHKFKENDKIAYTTSHNSEGNIVATPHMHYKCCMKHLKYQRLNASEYQTKKFIFHCPFRNEIDFCRSSLDIQFVYKREL